MFRETDDPDVKEKFVAKLKRIYQKDGEKDVVKQDNKYDRIMSSYDRL